MLVYAGAGIVEGTNPSLEWEELDLKESQVQTCAPIIFRNLCGYVIRSLFHPFQFARLLQRRYSCVVSRIKEDKHG